MRPQRVHLGGEEMRMCKFCGKYLEFAEECQYVTVHYRTKEGKKGKQSWLCCAKCLDEYGLRSVKQ